jgi:DNA-binding NtrC family response regulator
LLIPTPLQVVFIDDDPVILELFRVAMESIKLDINASYFDNAKEALAFVAKEKVRVVFSDISMPDMNGQDLLEECQKLKLGISFYVVTGTESILIADNILRGGARGFVRKPIKEQALVLLLSEAIAFYENWNALIMGIVDTKIENKKAS